MCTKHSRYLPQSIVGIAARSIVDGRRHGGTTGGGQYDASVLFTFGQYGASMSLAGRSA